MEFRNLNNKMNKIYMFLDFSNQVFKKTKTYALTHSLLIISFSIAISILWHDNHLMGWGLVLMCVLAPISYSYFLILSLKRARNINPFKVSFYFLLNVLLFVFVYSIATFMLPEYFTTISVVPLIGAIFTVIFPFFFKVKKLKHKIL